MINIPHSVNKYRFYVFHCYLIRIIGSLGTNVLIHTCSEQLKPQGALNLWETPQGSMNSMLGTTELNEPDEV